jgi:hypothetical protein
MPKNWTVTLVVMLLAGSTLLRAQSGGQPQQHAEHSMGGQHDMHHYDDVNQHGDTAMGFSHMKSTHHFRLTAQGGTIEVQANDAKDTETRDQIRTHLQEISKLFKAGDFSAPEFTHSRVPPGVAAMQRLKADITYRYEELPNGGRVVITTKNAEALTAVHDFLHFQIEDHRTGDPMTMEHK